MTRKLSLPFVINAYVQDKKKNVKKKEREKSRKRNRTQKKNHKQVVQCEKSSDERCNDVNTK
jgi:hypothetical protein